MPKNKLDKRKQDFKKECEACNNAGLIDLLAFTVSDSTSQRETGWVEADIDFAIWAEEYIIDYAKKRFSK